MTPIAFTRAIPLLRSFSEAQAKAFYGGFLGMDVDWEHRFEPGMPLYMQVSRGALVLHLTEHFGDASPHATVFIPMTGVAAFQADLAAKQHPNCRPGIVDQPWGREMTITDPFGNRLRFCEMAAGETA
jgi:catechol 2,3-dioxygenase-like lactoylglutathione lyase family enzyme